MIAFLKRWFITKAEAEALWSHHDHIASYVQELRKSNEVLRKQVDELTDAVTAPQRMSDPSSIDSVKSSNYFTARFNVAETPTIDKQLLEVIDRMMVRSSYSVENFIRKCREGRCSVLVTMYKHRASWHRGQSKITKQYGHGILVITDKTQRTASGRHKIFKRYFQSPTEREQTKAYFEFLKIPYTSGHTE